MRGLPFEEDQRQWDVRAFCFAEELRGLDAQFEEEGGSLRTGAELLVEAEDQADRARGCFGDLREGVEGFGFGEGQRSG